MSFLTHGLHQQQNHAAYFLYNFQNGATVCLACFLNSLADAAVLDSRKAFALREFMALFASDGPQGSRPLHDLLSQHASTVVDGLLSAFTASQDIGMAQALCESALHMAACCPDFLPELFTERLLQLLLELAWPGGALDPNTAAAAVQSTATVASCLQLLQQLVSMHSTSAQLLAAALQTCPDLVCVMTGGLACGLEAVAVPLIHIFSCLAHGSSIAPAAAAGHTGGGSSSSQLPPGLAKELFASLLQLLPDLLAHDLKLLVLQLLLRLAETGYAVEQATQQQPPTTAALAVGNNTIPGSHPHNDSSQQQQQQQQPSHSLPAIIMAGLKPILLDTNSQLQLLGCQLLVAVASRGSALLLQQLIASDVCEHVFEVVRGTLSSCSMRANLAGAAAAAEEQRRRAGPGCAAGVGGTGGAGSAAAGFEAAAEALQSAAITALRYLASQGPSFMEHFHFGLDTLTELLRHATASCNTPVLADTLLLLAGLTAPDNPGSLLLPMAALARLAAAAVGVLPDGAQAGGGGAGGQREGLELQPSPELQAAYEASCSVLTHLCLKWGSASSSSWSVLQPHILAGSQKALAAFSLLSSRSLAAGFLVAACKLLTVTAQLLTSDLAANGTTQEQQQQQLQQKHGKKGSSNQQVHAVLDDKPFAKRRQQQQQQQRLTAGSSASTAAGTPAAQAAVDGLLFLLEGVLLHLVPAATKVLTAARNELAAAAQAAAQQQQQVAMFVELVQGVVQVLLALLSSSGSNAELASFLPSFARQLLGQQHSWASTSWILLEALHLNSQHANLAQQTHSQQQLLPGAAAVAADVWHVLLLAADQLEGPSFMPGSTANIPSLAASLCSKASSSIALLELLCTGSSTSSQPAPGSSTQQPHQPLRQPNRHQSNNNQSVTNSQHNGQEQRGGSSAGLDIRRFCGVCELHRAALCIVAAALRCGDVCWVWQDVLTALDAAVGTAGPGMLSQPELLLSIVLLYCQAERQLAADLAVAVQDQAAAAQHGGSSSILLTGTQQQQQSGGVAAGAAALLAAQLPVPNCILHALEKLGRSMPSLTPDSGAAQWMCARAGQLPGAVQQQLQRWMAELLPACTAAPAAAAGAGSNGNSSNGSGSSGGDGSTVLLLAAELQQQVAAAVTEVLVKYPAALQVALLLARKCLDSKQQLLLAGWLTIFASVLHSHGCTASDPGCCDYLALISHHSSISQHGISNGSSSSGGYGSSSSSSSSSLQLLLLGPSGLLELSRRALLAAARSASSSWDSSYVVLCCSSCLLAAVVTVGAAGGAAAGGAAGQQQQLLELQLLQHGIQQVLMSSTRLLQLQASHPLHFQLLFCTANAANALLHAGMMQQQDPALLQLLAECHELNHVMVQLAAAATTDSSSSSALQKQQQQVLPLRNAAEHELEQLVAVTHAQCGLGSSSSGGSSDGGGSTPVACSSTVMALGPVSKEALLMTALMWQQHQQAMQLSGCWAATASNNASLVRGSQNQAQLQQQCCMLPVDKAFSLWQASQKSTTAGMAGVAGAGGAGSSSATAHTDTALVSQQMGQWEVYGLSAAQLLLLAQGAGDGGLLSLLLLDSVRLLLLRQAAAQPASRQQQHWPELLAVLQNAAVSAASSSSLYQEAAVSCLAALYAAAAGASQAGAAAGSDDDSAPSSNGGGAAAAAAGVVASSPWNRAVLRGVLGRMCQQAVSLGARAQAAEQAAAQACSAGGGVQGCSSGAEGAAAAAAAAAAGMCSWLCDEDCQQQCQLWCCDAQLLLYYIHLVSAAATAAAQSDAAPGSGSSGKAAGSKRSGSQQRLSEVQQLLLPFLEQQQLVSFLCWAAARINWAEVPPEHSSSLAIQQQQLGEQYGGVAGWQQQAGWNSEPHDSHHLQQQQQHLPAPAAAPRCLQLCLSQLSLHLLAALVHAGCLQGQLPWLQQQLQQQMWAVSQQQQQRRQGQHAWPDQQQHGYQQQFMCDDAGALGLSGGCFDTTGVLPAAAAAAPASSAAAAVSGVLLASGGLQMLSGVEAVNGVAVGLLRPCVLQLVAAGTGIGSGGGVLGQARRCVLDCAMLLDAVAGGVQLPQQHAV